MQNDKMVAEYLVQTLKDNLDDLEDRYTQLNREYKRSYRECDLLQRNHARIQKEYQILQQSVKGKCELVEKNGLTISNHLEQIRSNYGRNESSNGRSGKEAAPVHNATSPRPNEIKLNGYHKETTKTSPNSLNYPNASLNSSNSNHYKLAKYNGQLDDSPGSNGPSGEQLTNGFIKSSLPNGLNSSISSAYANHSSSSLTNNLNRDNKRHTDLSSCSSLSSTNDKTSCSSSSLIFSEEVYQFLTYVEGKTLNDKINYLLHDKIKQIQRIKALKSSLDDQKIRSIKLESLSLINGKQLNGDLHRRFNQNDDGKKTIENYKKELELLAKQMEQLSENKSQIDNEIDHLKARLQTMEATENELKTEKRKLLRDFRESQAKIEELDTEHYHLQKRIDKLSSKKQ